jgi:hypothetical protein
MFVAGGPDCPVPIRVEAAHRDFRGSLRADRHYRRARPFI